MNHPYDFDTQKTEGALGEAFLDAFFATVYNIERATTDEQLKEIDRWFTNRKTGNRFSVEYKTDGRAGQTGNAFVETVSKKEKNKPGWASMSAAVYLIYFIPEPQTIYVIPFERLRDRLPSWKLKYRAVEVPNKTRTVGSTWTTIGLPVPLKEFEKCAIEVF